MTIPLFHPESRRATPLALSALEFLEEFPEEGTTIEFKSGTSGAQLQNTAVAFSNTGGGVILIGVRDDRSIAGRRLDGGTQDDIHQALHAARDVGRYTLQQFDVDGKPVAVVSVSRRREGFAQTSDGVVRVRRGSRDDALFGAELLQFMTERTHTRYETTAVSIRTTEADDGLRGEVRVAHGWTRATQQRLVEADLATGGGVLTVAGTLFLTVEPSVELGKTYAELRRYVDDTGVDYVNREELSGPLHRLVDEIVERLAAALGRELVVLGARRYELARLPTIVLREVVANALGHRSYENAGTPVVVELRPSAVVVRSPGGLPEPVTVENMREANAARNHAVMRTLRRFGLAEDAGRGIAVIQDTMAEEMLDPPQFEDRGHEVVVRLPIRSAVAPTERAWLQELQNRDELVGAERLILVQAARSGEVTNGSVRELLDVDALEARAMLQRLRNAGFLQQHGERGGATYTLDGSLQPPAGLRLSVEHLRAIVIGLAEERAIANSDVRAATGLDRLEALRILDGLVADGELTREGVRRSTRYHRVGRSS